MIVHTFNSNNPKRDATAFSAILAVDKGVPSDVRRTRGGWLVVADDGKAVRFLRS